MKKNNLDKFLNDTTNQLWITFLGGIACAGFYFRDLAKVAPSSIKDTPPITLIFSKFTYIKNDPPLFFLCGIVESFILGCAVSIASIFSYLLIRKDAINAAFSEKTTDTYKKAVEKFAVLKSLYKKQIQESPDALDNLEKVTWVDKLAYGNTIRLNSLSTNLESTPMLSDKIASVRKLLSFFTAFINSILAGYLVFLLDEWMNFKNNMPAIYATTMAVTATSSYMLVNKLLKTRWEKREEYLTKLYVVDLKRKMKELAKLDIDLKKYVEGLNCKYLQEYPELKEILDGPNLMEQFEELENGGLNSEIAACATEI